MLWVRGVGFQSLSVLELGVENNIAGVIDTADIHTNLQLAQAGNEPSEPFEAVLEKQGGLTLLLGGLAGYVPHDDVLDHSRFTAEQQPALLSQRLKNMCRGPASRSSG